MNIYTFFRKGGSETGDAKQISKAIGVPYEIYQEFDKQSSIAIAGYIKLLGEDIKDPQRVEFLKILQKYKQAEEDKTQKIVDERAGLREREIESRLIKDHEDGKFFSALFGAVALFLVLFVLLATVLYAITMIIPTIVFSWPFVLMVDGIIVFVVFLWNYLNKS